MQTIYLEILTMAELLVIGNISAAAKVAIAMLFLVSRRATAEVTLRYHTQESHPRARDVRDYA